MSVKKNFGYYILYILTRPLSLLPLGFHRFIGRKLGKFTGSVVQYRRDVVLTNLARCFPEKKYDEISSICNRFYAHFGKVIAETIWYGRPNINAALSKTHFVSVENPEFLGHLYDQGKTVFALTAHCGNWEIYGGICAYCEPKLLKYSEKEICSVYKQLSNPSWEAFMFRNRCNPVIDKKSYDGLQESKNVLRYALKHRDQTKFYICYVDQYPYNGTVKVPVTFMGQSTYTMNGFPTLASKLGATVLYISQKENEDGNYSLHFSTICEDASAESPEKIMKKYYSRLEEDLRSQPWNYLWTHKRWK